MAFVDLRIYLSWPSLLFVVEISFSVTICRTYGSHTGPKKKLQK